MTGLTERNLLVTIGMKMKARERGQALLVIILIIVVVLTVVLSAASRSITNLRLSTEEENSQRAFSAAEAGIEQLLSTGQEVTTSITLGDQSSIKNVTVAAYSSTDFYLNDGISILKDDGADLWLIEHDTNGQPDFTAPMPNANITVHWGLFNNPDGCNNAALEAIVITGESLTGATSKRSVFDMCDNRRTENRFSNASVGGGGSICNVLPFMKNLGNVQKGLLIRFVPLYKNAIVCIESNKALPSQGRVINATGESGGTERKITFFQGFPKLPAEFFPYILFVP